MQNVMNSWNNFYIWTLINKWTAQLMRCDFFFLYIKHCPRTRMSMKICRQPQTKNWRGDERSQKYTVLKVSPTSHISTIWRLITVLYKHLVFWDQGQKGWGKHAANAMVNAWCDACWGLSVTGKMYSHMGSTWKT